MRRSCADPAPARGNGGVDVTAGSFGPVLRELREAAELTQKALAKAVFRDHTRISRWEGGYLIPSAEDAALLDEALGSTPRLTELAAIESGGTRPARRRRAFPPRAELPPAPAALVGRDAEIVEIVERLRTGRHAGNPRSSQVCLISGMAGSGKTALAATVADRLCADFPDGQLFLDLFGFSTSGTSVEEALEALLIQLDVPAGARRAGRPKLVADLRTETAGLHLLVVLENVPTTAHLQVLTSALPGSTAIATSRHRLTAEDEVCRIDLGALSVDAAEALFRLTAGPAAIRRSREGSDDEATRQHIRTIVKLCYRLPLGVHLIATRVRDNATSDLGDLEDALTSRETRLGEIENGERSLEQVIAASLAMLPDPQRQALAALSVHPGVRINRHSASVLLATSSREAEKVLNGLLRSCLLTEGSVGAYDFHDPIRDFVRHGPAGVAPADADRKQLLQSLVEHYLWSALAADNAISPGRIQLDLAGAPRPATAMTFDSGQLAVRWLSSEQANLLPMCREMLRQNLPMTCWRFCYYLRGYFYETKRWASWVPVFRLGVDAAERLGRPELKAIMLNNVGLALAESGDPLTAAQHHLEARQAFEAAGDKPGAAIAGAHYGWAQFLMHHHAEARTWTLAALETLRVHGTPWHVATTSESLAAIEAAQGDLRSAAGHLGEAEQVFAVLGMAVDVERVVARLAEVREDCCTDT